MEAGLGSPAGFDLALIRPVRFMSTFAAAAP
jgi:hypothetical protein